MQPEFKIVYCEPERHADAVLAIFNDAIANTTALYEYKSRTREAIHAWFSAKANADYPVVGVENSSGELLGFASYGPFRAWPAYKYSVEHSVYVAARFRQRGVGRLLLERLIESARDQDYHVLVGGIDAANEASIALHRSLGFSHCGTVKQVGWKFGRWLDLSFYQLTLSTPARPIGG
jgi:phosphinothricin acetyltransferase